MNLGASTENLYNNADSFAMAFDSALLYKFSLDASKFIRIESNV